MKGQKEARIRVVYQEVENLQKHMVFLQTKPDLQYTKESNECTKMV